MRDPWGDEKNEKSTAVTKDDGGHTGKQRDTGCGSTSFGGSEKLLPLSNRSDRYPEYVTFGFRLIGRRF